MAFYTIDSDGTTANRAALTVPGTSTAGTFFDYMWVNNSDAALTIQYTITHPTTTHDWNEGHGAANHDLGPANVRRYGPQTGANTGFYVVTLPAKSGGVLRMSGDNSASAMVIPAVTNTVKPVKTTHQTSSANGDRFTIRNIGSEGQIA